MSTEDRVERARDLYLAFAAGNRNAVERMLTDDFTFSSPLDVGLTARATSSAAGRARVGDRTSSSCACYRQGTR